MSTKIARVSPLPGPYSLTLLLVNIAPREIKQNYAAAAAVAPAAAAAVSAAYPVAAVKVE